VGVAAILVLWVLSGATLAFCEVLQFRYGNFKRLFKAADDQYWNPKVSWINKYKVDILVDNKGLPRSVSSIGEPRFLFSLTLLRWATDGFHLMQSISSFLAAIGWALAFLVLHSFGVFALDVCCQNFLLIFSLVIVHYITKGIGFFFTYALI
jgi:hypothetical protein